MDRCNVCVMPLNKVEHKDGTCVHCLDHADNIDWPRLEQEFAEIVDSYRGTGDRYDFMVLMTGGKDSSYVLYYLTKICKARVLAFTWDNGLIRESAWRNIHNAVQATGIDHMVFQFYPKEDQQRVNVATLRAVGYVCFCPQYFWLASMPMAIKLGIPVIVNGFSEGQREGDHSYKIPEAEPYRRDIVRYFQLYEEFYEGILREYEPDNADRILQGLFSPLKPYIEQATEIDFPRFVPLANYISWMDVDTLEATLGREIGYKKATAKAVHTSCYIEPIRGYLENHHGAPEISIEIACLVRCGAFTRDQGLYELDQMGFKQTMPELDYQLLFGTSKEQFAEYVRSKPVIPKCLMKRRKSIGELRGMLKELNTFLPWVSGYSKS